MYSKIVCYLQDLEKCIDATIGVERLKNQRILIAGSTGLIGSFLVDMLLLLNQKRGYDIEVYALARNGERLRKRFPSHLNNKNLHLVEGDVTKEIKLDSDIDYLIHGAGDGFPAAFREYPFETMTPVLVGTSNLLEFARTHHVKRFLLLSSGEIYGKNETGEPFLESDLGKVDSMDVRECYPQAKRCAETMCVSFFQEYGLECVIARLSHVFGACTSERDNHATVQFLRQAVQGNNIVLYSKGNQLRSYIYIVDAISGILSTMLNGVAGQAYNISNDKNPLTIYQFAELLANEAGVDLLLNEPNVVQKKELTPIQYAVLSSKKLEGLGWKTVVTTKEAIRRMYEIARSDG